MDIKIDAVFSLVNENKQDSPRRFAEQKDSNHVPKPDMIVIKEEVHDPAYDFAEFHEKHKDQQWSDYSTDSVDLPLDTDAHANGADTPPALSIEKDTGMFQAMLYDTKRESMPPPVLMPEIGFKREEVAKEEGRLICTCMFI